MEKRILLIIAAGLCCLAACNKEVEITETPESTDPANAKMITETITANLGTSTKVTIANSASDNFAWTAGDNIAVHVSNGDSHKYVVTSSGASYAAASASFTVSYEEGYSRDAFAVYPSTIVATNADNYGQESTALDVTLPNEYTLAQVTGTTSPCPMIASNTGSGWDFYHLCGLLRLTVNSIPGSANKITVNFNGNKVHGDFSVATPVTAGTSSIATETGSSDDEITITFDAAGTWRDGVDINLPLPTGDYTDITVTAFNGDTELLSMTRPVKVGAASYNVALAAGKKCTTSLPAFSVSDSKRVVIASSNLKYNKATSTFSFMDHPWSYFETTGMTVGEDYSNQNTVGLFAWATSGYNGYLPTRTVQNNYNYGPSIGSGEWTSDSNQWDWGYNNQIGSDAAKTWRVPTMDEWLYLFGMTENNTDNSSITKRYKKYCRSKVNDMNGIILVPDNFVDPKAGGDEHNTAVSWWGQSSRWATGSKTYYDNTSYDTTGWDIMSAAGAIFLPCVGYRGAGDNGGVITDFNASGFYWSSTAGWTTYEATWGARALNFSIESVMPAGANGRKIGEPVRLVRDL